MPNPTPGRLTAPQFFAELNELCQRTGTRTFARDGIIYIVLDDETYIDMTEPRLKDGMPEPDSGGMVNISLDVTYDARMGAEFDRLMRTPEDKQFVAEAISALRSALEFERRTPDDEDYRGFLNAQAQPIAKRVGQRIMDRGGLTMMQATHTLLRAYYPEPGIMRTLEFAWDGIAGPDGSRWLA